jgi:hypothetical protein
LKEFKSEMEMFEVFEKLKIREEGANLWLCLCNILANVNGLLDPIIE